MPTSPTREELARRVALSRSRTRQAMPLALATVLVFLTVFLGMRRSGVAAVRTERVLDCPVVGTVAHHHDASCYDTEGNLVCPLPELELHTHDDSCYAETRKLACGLEEGAGAHTHGDGCYDNEGILACGLEESSGHVHDESCYQLSRTLVCGKEEVTVEHVHGAGCFTGAENSMPAQEFSHRFEDEDGALVLGVSVSAPEGALPAGTTMQAVWTEADEVDRELVQAALDVQADKDGQPAGKIVDLQAIDITFFDATGAEVRPAQDVTVTLASALVASGETPQVVGVETDAQAQARAAREGKSTYKIAAGAVETLSGKELEKRELTLSDDQLAFDDGTYTQYVLATTTRAMKMRSVGDTSRIVVDAPAEAGVPQGSTIQVTEVVPGTREYQAYEKSALDAISASDAELARFFDITILDPQGNEVQPQAPVSVKIKLSDAPTGGEQPSVVHFDETAGEAAPEVIPADATNLTTKFEAESFSVYGVVYTVDFSYDVDGQTFEMSLPGGDVAAMSELLPALGVVDEADAKRFVSEIDEVRFTNTDVASVIHLDEDMTVGALHEHFDLPVQYSASLTEAQRAAIEAKTLKAGDWALVSIKPFSTDETLTVTMKNGEAFTIRVTDEQISTRVMASSGKAYDVTVTYDETAGIPEGSTLRVIEFVEGTEAYDYARSSVLADRKARGSWVDLGSFGLAALDISIISPAGKEIEPASEVQVDIQIKELPGVEDLNEVASTLEVQHHVEVKDGVVVETVFDGGTEASFGLDAKAEKKAGTPVDPSSVSEADFAKLAPVAVEILDTKFEVTAFSTFTISWNYAYGNGTRIHYVDENGQELNVDNTTFPTTLTRNSTSPAYLIYDIEGYEYDHTYRRYNEGWGWRNQNIVPELRRARDGWQYNTNRNDYNWNNGAYLSASNAWYKDEIYVVYKKKNAIAQGGTPTVKQSGDVDPPVIPRINKESTPNGDDTNTLALSLISDTAQLEVEKLADVIVVFDVSGSMSTNDMGGTRLQAAKDAVNSLAKHLSEKVNSDGDPLVRMSLIQFSTKASTVLGMTDLTTEGNDSGLKKIERAVNGLEADGGTNWDHALQLANEENDLDGGRATFVIFVTDGDPTFRNARMDRTDAQLAEEKNYHENENTYTDPNYWYMSDSVYGPGNNDRTGQCYAAAVKQGRAIVAAGKNIYTIGISNDVTKVDTFNTAIGGNGAFKASDSQGLQDAFKAIETSISGASGWGNIKMTDGITNLSNTVQKTGLTNVGGDFSYWIAEAPENWASMTDEQKNAYEPAASDFKPWDPEAAGAALATYNEQTGAVEWNMGKTFMPEAGVTYQVRFKVWPSQEAYDYIAKLNNGTLDYDTLPEDVKAQIIKSGSTYTLKTNEPNANTTYQPAVRTGKTVTVSGKTETLEFPSVKDLKLSVDKMKVQKEWVNDLDPDARWKSDVTLLLTDGAGNLYKSIPLNEDNDFTAEDNFISCGLAKIEDGELVIYEKGHDFKLTEPAEYAYYWDLDSQAYRPMVINAQLTMLVKTDAPDGMGEHTYYQENGTTYYKIDGGTYKAISTGDAAAAITATNIRRSNLNLMKEVVDEKDKPVISSAAFTFVITVNDTQDADVWFSVQTDPNDTATIVKDLATDATPEEKNGEHTGFFHAPSGSPITVSLQPGWNLRFTNLPNGTTYTITEVAQEGYALAGATIDHDGTFSVEDGTTTGTGTISESNTQYTVTYANRAVTHEVNILKTDQQGEKPLHGAVFDLYTKSGYERTPRTASKTNLTSDDDGLIELGKLAVGTYYLVETVAPDGYNLLAEPVEITVASDGVTYNQSDSSLSMSGDGISFDEETGTYTLTVTNDAGIELPEAGGPGTTLLVCIGAAMVATGVAVLTRRRRMA